MRMTKGAPYRPLRCAALALVLAGLAAACAEDPGAPTTPAPEADLVALGVPGAAVFPALEVGRVAHRELLTAAEREVLALADARAEALRTRPLILLAPAGATVRLAQVRHAFGLSVAMDLRKFADEEPLAWYTARVAETFNTVVLENEVKWRVVEPTPGARDFAAAGATVAWAEANGLAVKGHTLVWGNGPPLSGTGVPEWLVQRFPDAALTAAAREELRGHLQRFVTDTVAHFRGRIVRWDVTNEANQPYAQWFVDRLGPEVVADAFAWARAADPDVTLMANEWTAEIFTGLGGPTADVLRDAVQGWLRDGVPIGALGLQAQFTPGIAHLGVDADLRERTPIDVVAQALDTLAEAGVPLRITECNIFAPDDPELRAAQLDGLMRLWWGHPAVAEIGIWSLWNAVSGKRAFGVGLWDDARQLTPHGAAFYHLVNDAWRTRTEALTDGDGQLALRAHPGDYVVDWTLAGVTYSARFSVPLGTEPFVVSLASAPTP